MKNYRDLGYLRRNLEDWQKNIDVYRYMLDTRAMSHMPGGVLGNIERYGQGAGHFHTNQPDGRGPGMGDFDFGPVLAALRDVHYLNWVSCEPFDYTPDSVTVARTALQTLRAAAPVSGRGA